MKHLPIIFVTALLSASMNIVSAGGSAEASAQALTHSLEALGYAVEGSLKLASGAAAVPLMFAGEIGAISGEVGNELYEEANAPPHGAFPVTDEVITVGPAPAEQLEHQDEAKQENAVLPVQTR
jgi:hypothetical protein